MIHEEICTYEVAKLAKEKGFPQGFNYTRFKFKWDYYNHKGELHGDLGDILKLRIKHKPIPEEMKPIAAPTQSLLQRWLREEKNIHIEIIATASGYYWCVNKTNGTSITDSDVLNRGTNDGGCFDTFEEGLEDALKYALENLICYD